MSSVTALRTSFTQAAPKEALSPPVLGYLIA